MPTSPAQIEREKVTIRHMIAIYCRGRHGTSRMCESCAAILRYASERIDACPFQGSTKPVCGLCRANCFSAEMHGHFKRIMRYAGMRMLVRHPVLTVAHLIDAVRSPREPAPLRPRP